MTSTFTNPTTQIPLDFAAYLSNRESALSEHLIGGVPDYAFDLDLSLRQKLATLAPVRAFAKAVTASAVPQHKQQMQMQGVAVGPRQFPELYEMAEHCARTLGIGVPEVFVKHSKVLNAYTLATEDAAPIVVFHSELLEVMNPQEIMFIMGHECGHIHNHHGIYNTMAVLLSLPASGLLGQIPGVSHALMLAQVGFRLFLNHWSRCAEITCDRAGLICCEDLRASQFALAKLATGMKDGDVNLDQLLKQIEQFQQTPARFSELLASHPLVPKRIDALRQFERCVTLHDWRPEMRSTQPAQTRQEVDAEIASYINVFSKKYSAERGA